MFESQKKNIEAARQVEFEVLLHPKATDGPSAVESLEAKRPAAGNLVRCGYGLQSHGVEAHQTEFSVVCSSERALFEQLFATHLVENPEEDGRPPFICGTPPVVPQALLDCVSSIELAGQPIFFPQSV